jgi:UDP-glucose:(heptosyl)LPS alpha-1,3-glucosyltransferase
MDRWIFHGWRTGRTLRYLCNSRKVREEIVAGYGVPPERIDVLHNPVDPLRFDRSSALLAREETRRGLGIPGDATVALFSGSGWHRKGLDSAIRAVASSRSRPWLVVAGSDDPGAYARLARSLGIADRVVFAGLRGDIERVYAAADLLLAPTRYDAFSNATAEALAMGLPVITTETNGAAELIAQGREGFVVGRADGPRWPGLDPRRRGPARMGPGAAAGATFARSHAEALIKIPSRRGGPAAEASR